MSRLRRSAAMIATACALGAAGCGNDDDEASSTSATTSEAAAPSTSGTADTSATSAPGGVDGTTTSGPNSTTATEPPESARGDLATTLRGRYQSDPSVLDPIYVANSADGVNAQVVFENLVEGDADGEGIVNVLAETYEPSADWMKIDFTLREGVQFHDGYGELTAEDVKFSLERAAGIIPSEVESFAISYYSAMQRVDVNGKYSGTIVLKEPSSVLVEQAIPLTSIISKAAFEELGPEEFGKQPVGTGPYEFEEWVPGDHVRYTKFDEYSSADPTVPEPRFEELVFRIIPEDSAAELAYEAGDLDVLTQIRSASVSRFEARDDTVVSQGTGRGYRWIGMNVLDPALANENLRQAIIAAIDVPSIVQATSEGLDTRATALLAPSSTIGYWEDAPVHERDLDEARRLVETVPEANRTLTFTIGDDERSRTVAQIAQQQLEEAGLTIEIVIQDYSTFFTTGEGNRQRQLFYVEFDADFREPALGFLWFTCQQIDVWNYMYWCNEEFDAMLAEAQRTIDEEARGEIYIEMQKLWEEAAHTVWIAHPTSFHAARADTVELVVDPAGTVFWDAVIPK
jgi:peptide/nickel transport system substrate-binding protein